MGQFSGERHCALDSENDIRLLNPVCGLFNRTVNVHIGDRYRVTIRQQFSGRDIYHYFKAQMFITGTLPKLAEGTEIIYPDHEEEYRREGPGNKNFRFRHLIIQEQWTEPLHYGLLQVLD
ncbi:unnamed protein product [Gongylonema pulchrum]|uniref:Nidogen G2 beta-barrel domain-containing protein n=1 Tax=Gongylonema pulchrum TaxID=637853 RepID=A0A183DAM2_9BILA|nr:unnamed protein product [Gongylonema pulchrum]